MTRSNALRVVWTLILLLGIVELIGALVDGSYGLAAGGIILILLAAGWFATTGKVLRR